MTFAEYSRQTYTPGHLHLSECTRTAFGFETPFRRQIPHTEAMFCSHPKSGGRPILFLIHFLFQYEQNTVTPFKSLLKQPPHWIESTHYILRYCARQILCTAFETNCIV